MSSTWKAVVGVILVFVLGWLGGTVTTIVVVRHRALEVIQGGPEALAIVLERRTTRDLGLNDDQKKQVHALFVEFIRQRQELQKQLQPQVRAVNHETLQQIDAVLTPDQQQHFHDNLVLFKERFGRNPFNVAATDKAAPTVVPTNVGQNTNSPATNPPPAQ